MATMSRASRPASYATVFVAIVGALFFLYTLVGMTSYLQRSPWELLFSNPTGGSTLGEALLFFTIPVLLQAVIAFGLTRRSAWARMAGAIGAGLVAALCTLWIVLALSIAGIWLANGTPTEGMMPAGGDFQDFIGIVVFIPIAAILALLDGRAALNAARALRAA